MKFTCEYEARIERTKENIEAEMKSIIEENLELERILREAEDAQIQLNRNRRRMKDLTNVYCSSSLEQAKNELRLLKDYVSRNQIDSSGFLGQRLMLLEKLLGEEI